MCVLWHHGRGRRGDASAWSKGGARVVCERARGLADVSETEVEVTEEGSQRSRRSHGLRRGHETNSSLLMWLETTGNEEPGQRACLSHTGWFVLTTCWEGCSNLLLHVKKQIQNRVP